MQALARTLLPLVLLMPSGVFAQSTLVRLAEAGSGVTSRVAMATLYDTRFVTAAASGNASLELASWDVTRSGRFTKNPGTIENGASNEFVVLNIGNAGVAAAFVTPNGTLRPVSWSVGANGALRRTGAIGAGALARLSAAAIGDHRVITASQDAAGATKLIIWDIDAAGTFTRRGDVAGTPGSAVAVAVVSRGLVATAIRTASGKLEVATYALDPAGKLTSLGG